MSVGGREMSLSGPRRVARREDPQTIVYSRLAHPDVIDQCSVDFESECRSDV